MSDLIDRAAANAALEKLDELMRHRAETEDKEFVKVQVGITLARCEIDAIPTIDAAPVVHAKWVVNTDDFTPKKRCTNCGYNKPMKAGEGIEQEPEAFCPACGAMMDENGGNSQ